jgi:hypothetical protein
MIDANFSYIFISADVSLVLNTLIDPISRWVLRTLILRNTHPSSFESFSEFVKFPVAHTVIAVLNCYSALNFTGFHIL